MGLAGTSPKLSSLFILLVLELEYLLVGHYEIRTAVRSLFPIPIYHTVLSFLTICLIAWKLAPQYFPGRPKFSASALLCHLLLYAGLVFQIDQLWSWSEGFPKLLSGLLWMAAGASFLGTWLAAWLPPRAWMAEIGRSWRYLLPASAFSLFLPFLAEFASSNWREFASVTFWATAYLLSAVYPETVANREKLLLGTPEFAIEIGGGCSGYEGIALVAGLAAAYLWIRRNELLFPRALWLILAGAVLSWIANLFRLVLLVVIGSEISPDIAMRGFHSQAGWLSFTVIGLGLIFGTERGNWFRDRRQPEESVHYPALPYLAPLVATLFGTLMAETMRADFNYWYFLKPLLGSLALLPFLSFYRSLWKRPNWTISLGLGFLVYLLWVALERPAEAISPYDILNRGPATAWTVIRLLGAVLVIPVVEELVFRGYLLKRLQSHHFEELPDGKTSPLALILSSLAFGALHVNWLGGVLAGIGYGLATRARGGLSNAVIAHSFTNLLISFQVLSRDDWWLWG